MIRRTAKWWVPVVVAAGIVLVGWLAVLPRLRVVGVNDLVQPVPSRAAQSNLNAVVAVVQRQYAATGTLGSEPALADLVQGQDPGITLVGDRSIHTGAVAPIAVAVSADRQAALFATRANDGRCWFVYVDHRQTSPSPFPGTPSAPGTYYGGAGIGHGPNRSCSVTRGPEGTSGNPFVGWSASAFPPKVP